MAAGPSTVSAVKRKHVPFSQNILIKALQPQNMLWNMDVKIIAKSPVYISKDGSKKSLCVYLLDTESDEIRCTFYEKFCDKYYDNLQIGTVYNLSNCKVMKPNPLFNDMNLTWELKFHNKSQIVVNGRRHPALFVLKFSFSKFPEIEQMDDYSIIDIVGIVWCVGDIDTIIEKADPNKDKTYKKRDIDLIDLKRIEITVNVWDNNAVLFNESKEYTVVAMKRVKVTSFENVKKLTTLPSTIFVFDYQGQERMTAYAQKLAEECGSDSSVIMDEEQSSLSNSVMEDVTNESSGSSPTKDAEKSPSPLAQQSLPKDVND